MSIINNFVVFEGGDGSGTTTQLEMLRRCFGEPALPEGAPAICLTPRLWTTCEPTDGAIGRLIRSGLRGETAFLPETMARLFSADRSEHLYARGGIVERCTNGHLVVSDRYVLSSMVYQGINCGEDVPKLLNSAFPAPELLIFFDIEPEIALKRMENRVVREIYEHLDFQVRVRERYKALLPWYAENGVRAVTLDASRNAAEVAGDVWREIGKMPIMRDKE